MISVLGRGILGLQIYNYLNLEKNNNIQLISLRENKYNSNQILKKIFKSKIFFDCMDRNTIDLDQERLRNIHNIRKEICKLIDIFYIYISTTNLYNDSKNEISEKNDLIALDEYSYELNKLKTEEYLTNNLLFKNLLIARIPSIWSHNMNKGSFMGDLMNSYKNNKRLNYRVNDEKIISFINIINAVEIIVKLVNQKESGIFNITTNDWSSRNELKFGIKHKNKLTLGKRIISEKYNYKTFIRNKIKLN